MPPSPKLLSPSILGEPTKEEARLHRTAARAAWVAAPGEPTERAIFDPDAGGSSDMPPQLYREFSITFLLGTAHCTVTTGALIPCARSGVVHHRGRTWRDRRRRAAAVLHPHQGPRHPLAGDGRDHVRPAGAQRQWRDVQARGELALLRSLYLGDRTRVIPREEATHRQASLAIAPRWDDPRRHHSLAVDRLAGNPVDWVDQEVLGEYTPVG